MTIQTKMSGLVLTLILLCLSSGTAKADYWTKHTRVSSGNTLPQYFELENMAKSSTGLKFFYGTDRREMAGAGTDTRNLITFDGTNWIDQTEAAKTAGGYNDIEFISMYPDQFGNVWMPNRKDPNTPLLKYNGTSGQWEKISASTIASQSWPSGPAHNMYVKNIFGNKDNSNILYAVARGDDRLYILTYDRNQNKWSDSGISGGPLSSTEMGTEVWGMYNVKDGSTWIYQHNSSENEFTSGTDQGIGIWRYKNGSWTQFNSSTATSNGASFVNGITEAFVDSLGNVWVGSRHGVFEYDGSNWINWTKDNSNLFSNRIIKVQEDSDGRIWIVALENENVQDDNGGISIYNPADGTWDYYTSKNGEDALDNATNIFMLGQGEEVWMFTGHGEQFQTAGIYALTRDSSHTAIYGQISGTYVAKASFDMLKKKKTKNTSVTKMITIYKVTKVKKKTRNTRVYSGKTSTWYKALSLETGKYLIQSKAKGKKKKSRTIVIKSGDPYRLDLK